MGNQQARQQQRRLQKRAREIRAGRLSISQTEAIQMAAAESKAELEAIIPFMELYNATRRKIAEKPNLGMGDALLEIVHAQSKAACPHCGHILFTSAQINKT